jgi:hypothetical protein
MTLQVTSIQSKSGLQAVLSTLGFALPPSTVVHVGVGEGSTSDSISNSTSIWMDWGVQSAVLIEADSDKLERARVLLTRKGLKPESLHTVAEVVAGIDASDDKSSASKEFEVSFYRASHPRENSLLSPDALRAFWPSLLTSSVDAVKAKTIDDVLNETVTTKFCETVQVGEANQNVTESFWLIVDCLPAKRILSGAQALLGKASVVCVRVLREVRGLADDLVTDATAQSVDGYLKSFGFRRVAFVADSHPDVGHTVYCKDSQNLLEEQKKPLQDSVRQKESFIQSLNGQLQEARLQLEQKNQLADEVRQDHLAELSKLQTELDLVRQEKTQLNEQKDRIEEDAVAKQAELDQSKQLNVDLGQKLLQLKGRWESEKQVNQEAIQDLTAKLALEKKRSAEAQQHLRQELDETNRKLEQLQQAQQDILEQRDQAIAQTAQLAKAQEALESQRDTLARAKEDVIAEKSAIFADLERHKQLVTDLQSKLDSVTHSLQEESQRAADRTAKLDGVNAEKNTLAHQLDAVRKEVESIKASAEASTQEHQEQEQQRLSEIESLKAESHKLKTQNIELQHRQALMNEELVKAEGQLNLIKDLLLRENTFNR